MNEDNTKKEPDSSPSASEPVVTKTTQKKSWARRYLAVPTVIGIALVVYIAFFGEKSVTQRIEYQQAIDSLKTALNQEQDTLEYYRDLNRRLSTDPQLMEQVVREQYNMKRAHEDIYVVE
ncbi:MAG: septum formation initiator family protein [Muribaculaceae bacterium]